MKLPPVCWVWALVWALPGAAEGLLPRHGLRKVWREPQGEVVWAPGSGGVTRVPAPEVVALRRRGGAALGALPTSVLASPAVPWVLGCVLSGVAGTPIVVRATKSWYREIRKPWFTPPDWVFAPVWTVLYAMMGFSAHLVAASRGMSSLPVLAFLAHLALNLSWAPVFFGLQRLRPAAFLNIGLLSTLFGVMALFFPVNRLAAALLVPYAAWLLFATVLNFEIARLNPERGRKRVALVIGGGDGGGSGL
mmetsp:Transcript_10108/g.28806  ORF Transcript_10108/g.28806 Transcript_10108/m.28806 type:complete len:249 (-) Transcript_10108:245-991(-)